MDRDIAGDRLETGRQMAGDAARREALGDKLQADPVGLDPGAEGGGEFDPLLPG